MDSLEKNSVLIPLIFHFRQPYGNFDHIIENAYLKAYLPLVETLKHYPNI